MTSREALARMLELKVPAVTTSEAASVLGQSAGTASRMLTRLADANLIRRAAHGVWWLASRAPGPLDLVEPLAAPFAAYVSLHSALYIHGLIEQIPVVTYAVTLGRTHRARIATGQVSFHHLAPELFGGSERDKNGVPIATAEKALVDFAWLSGTRGRLFAATPELTLPRRFDRRAVEHWSSRLKAPKARAQLERAWARLLGARARSSEV